MPPTASAPSRKRKLSVVASATQKPLKKSTKKVKAPKPTETTQEDILELEDAIVESPKNYNNIVTLLGHFKVLPRARACARDANIDVWRARNL